MQQQEQNTHYNKNNNSITGAYWLWPKQFASWSCHWRERKFALESTRNLVMAKPRIFGKSSAQWKLQSWPELMHDDGCMLSQLGCLLSNMYAHCNLAVSWHVRLSDKWANFFSFNTTIYFTAVSQRLRNFVVDKFSCFKIAWELIWFTWEHINDLKYFGTVYNFF